MESQFTLENTWRDEVCARKTRKEIVQSGLIRCVHDADLSTEGVSVFLPQTIRADSEVEEVARRDAGWIRVGIVSAGWHDVDQGRSVMR